MNLRAGTGKGPPLPSPLLKGEYVFSAFQSQRDCVLQPRVARNELPWAGGPLNLNPERVLSNTLNRYKERGRNEERV